MTETPEETEDRVRRGAAYLDEHRPDWENHVDLQKLDMGSRRHCVLGQVYAEEGDALGTTGYDYATDWARAMGRLRGFASFGFDGWEADLLEAAWSAEIIRRR